MAETNRLDVLLEQSAKKDIPFLLKAKEEAKKKVKDDPTPANLAAFGRSKKMLDEAMSNQNGTKFLPDIKAVLQYLQETAGRKIGQSKLYNDINSGLLRRQPDKSFKVRDVDNYATFLPLVSMPQAKADGQLDLAEEKLKVEIGKLDEQRKSIIFDREIKSGKYILKEEVALELASRAASLSLGLRSVFRLNVADYIRMVGGKVELAETLAQEFENNLDMALNEYSKPMDFKTEFVAESSETQKNEDKKPDSETE